MPSKKQDEQLDKIFMALADATRRGLVHQLAQGSQTMSELAAPYDMSLAAISKHVKVLEQAGLISRQIEGRTHHIQLNPTPLATAVDWIAIYRRFWQDNFDELERVLSKSKK